VPKWPRGTPPSPGDYALFGCANFGFGVAWLVLGAMAGSERYRNLVFGIVWLLLAAASFVKAAKLRKQRQAPLTFHLLRAPKPSHINRAGAPSRWKA